MLTIICCNRYYVVAKTSDRAEALRIARAHVDGTYACVITQDGRTIGDCVDGFYTADRLRGEHYTDAATLTGMYDR